MFDSITKKSHEFLQAQIDELKATCEKDPAVAELVRPIVAYSDQLAYCGGDEEAKLGREIIQMIWQISKIDLSNLGNEFHFSPNWAAQLNHFIGNYVYDDSGFDFEQSEFNGTFEFRSASDHDRWLQNPLIIVEAAKANRAYYKKADEEGVFSRLRDVADGTKVMELLK